MTIQQFNANWHPIEDRIIFRFNTDIGDEYRLWLSRFWVCKFFQIALKQMELKANRHHNSNDGSLIQDFERASVKNKIKKTSGKFISGKNFPLGENPLLAVGVTILKKDLAMSLRIKLISGQNLNLPVNLELLKSMVFFLETSQEKAGWGINSESLKESRNSPSKLGGGLNPIKIVH